jgi:hypothetical protein
MYGLSEDEIIPTFKRVEFVKVRMPYSVLRGRWCDIIVLNVNARKEDKIVYTQDCCFEEL